MHWTNDLKLSSIERDNTAVYLNESTSYCSHQHAGANKIRPPYYANWVLLHIRHLEECRLVQYFRAYEGIVVNLPFSSL
jgi:hypothetical protein